MTCDVQQNGLNYVTKTSPPAVHWMFADQVSDVRQQHLAQRNTANRSTSDRTRVNSASQIGSSFPHGHVLARPRLKVEGRAALPSLELELELELEL